MNVHEMIKLPYLTKKNKMDILNKQWKKIWKKISKTEENTVAQVALSLSLMPLADAMDIIR